MHPLAAMVPLLALVVSSCADPSPPAAPPLPAPPPAAPPPVEPPSGATAPPPVAATTAVAPTAAPPATPAPAASLAPAPGPPARGAIGVKGATGTATLTGDALSVSLQGSPAFARTCDDSGRISIKDGSAWKPAATALPPKGNYVLDGKYQGYGMCDVMVCNPASLTAQLRQYKEVGPQSGHTAYASSPITGSIQVEFTYFTDRTCQTPKTLTVTLDR
jgi:hypothetical protein